MNKLNRVIVTILTGSALATTSNMASAVSLYGTVNASTSSPVTLAVNSAPKNWADLTIDLGWMHTTNWVQVNIPTTGAYTINLTDTSTGISMHPAFSVWSLGGANNFNASAANMMVNAVPPVSTSATHYTSAANNDIMGYNQVAAPSPTNSSKFLSAGGVTGFVGYANAGVTFTNGNGDFVGHGSSGSSWGSADPNLASETGNLGGIAGHGWAELFLGNLSAGNYILAVGGNCDNLVSCGNSGATPGSWVAGKLALTVTAVPVPGAVWLMGSALAGIGIFGRRRDKAIA